MRMACTPIFFLYLLAVSLCAQPLEHKTFGNIFKKARDSVVTIKVSATEIVNGQPKTVEGGGSGVIVASDGLIVTNKHVVKDTTRSFKVILSNGKELAASFVGMAPDTDLSLIKLVSLPVDGVRPIDLGDSDRAEEGDWVLVIGSPFGLGGTLTVGIISARERMVPIPSVSGQVQPHALIQTDAPINPGNSGGALIDLDGKLIGIPTMNLSTTGSSAGVGLAIPVDVVKRVIQDVASKKTMVGWLGMLIQDIVELSPTARKQLGISAQSGVIVTGLEPAGPAQKAGIKQYDAILSVNGQNMTGVSNFQWLERNLNPGEIAILKILRRGTLTAAEIKIEVGQPIKQKTGQK